MTLTVFDAQGREIARLLDRAWRTAGEQRVDLAGALLSPGLYWARLATPDGTRSTRLVRIE